MNDKHYQEDRSLLEVRAWKEQCGQQTEHFTPEEYIQWIKSTTTWLSAKYGYLSRDSEVKIEQTIEQKQNRWLDEVR